MTREKKVLLGAVGLLGLLSACSSSNPASTGGTGITRQTVPNSAFTPTQLETTINSLVSEINKQPTKTMQLGVVTKALTGYFQPIEVGANRAISELKAVGGVVAPANTSDTDAAISQQDDMINNYVAGNYDGIGVAPFSETVVPSMNAAVDQGIPVVTIDSDVAESKRQVYVGTINSAAGTTGGQTLIDLLAPVTSGTVIVLGHDDPSWVDGYNRTMSAKAVLEESGFTVQVIKTIWSDETGEVSNLTTLIQAANPPIIGMIGMFSDAYRCAMAAEAAGKAAGEIQIAAFDFDANTVSYMNSGYIQATHAQRQYYMGYVVPYILYGIKKLGLDQTKAILKDEMVDETSFNTGLDVVPAANLDGYHSFLDSLGVGSQ